MGCEKSSLREGYLSVCCYLVSAVEKGGASSKLSSECLKDGSGRRGKMDLGGTALFFWIGLALGRSSRY